MTRIADHAIEKQFTDRHSPRALNGEPVTKETLLRLFEAARWAPSSSNLQPWRFVYGVAKTPAFEGILSVLVDFNKSWAKNAGALVVVASHTQTKDGKPNRTHGFDAGAAWMSLALQAHALGLVAHGMAGFDYDKAGEIVGLPANHEVHAVIAIGHPGDAAALPEHLRKMEAPNGREAATSFVFEGKF